MVVAEAKGMTMASVRDWDMGLVEMPIVGCDPLCGCGRSTFDNGSPAGDGRCLECWLFERCECGSRHSECDDGDGGCLNAKGGCE